MPEKEIIISIGWLLAGLAAGSVHVAALWINVQFLMRPGKRPVALVMLLGRFLLLGAVLFVAAWNGTAAFLWATCGVLVARPLVLRLMKDRVGPEVAMGEEGHLR
ncbi:ATP synthase subunit I [Gluconobacter roseus]|uniref:ATP synthase subunit I n=1 Tax=Gluconobacter roseus TaxID=586239 RepID=UPI0038D12A2E